MVDIPDDEDLVDHDGDDEEPEEEPEKEPEQQIGHENHDAPEGYCDYFEHLRVIEDLSTHLGNLEYRHGVLMRKMEEVSDVEVADNIAIGEIHPRVATVGDQVESRVNTYSSGQMAVSGQDEIVGLSHQCRCEILIGD
nr:hypothetical protein [Tanacetum cinerariifolium]